MKLLQRHAPAAASRGEEPPLPLQVKQMPERLRCHVESLPSLLEELYDHPIWQEIGERCLGCGACTLLCPTCYCFNVQDKLDLNLESGERLRTWDSCQFDQFTQVLPQVQVPLGQAPAHRLRRLRALQPRVPGGHPSGRRAQRPVPRPGPRGGRE